MSNYTEQQIYEWKAKAEKWDALGKEIEDLYYDEEGNEWPEDKYDLVDIGEAAAMAFDYL